MPWPLRCSTPPSSWAGQKRVFRDGHLRFSERDCAEKIHTASSTSPRRRKGAIAPTTTS